MDLNQAFDDERAATAIIESQRVYYGNMVARREAVMKTQSELVAQLRDEITEIRSELENLRHTVNGTDPNDDV